MTGCPSSQQLAEVLSDHLVPGEQAQLEAHLGDCTLCQEFLLQLAGATPPLLQGWRVHAGTTTMEPSTAFLQRLRQAVLAQELPEQTEAPEPWPTPPGFDVLEEIGRSRLSVVYKARQHSLRRLVALKLLRTDPTREAGRRARRTRDLIANLRHPNIVQFHDVVEFDGQHAIVLEYLEGGSLRQHLHGRPWPAHEAARLVQTLAETVESIHVQGIVHRDLKPSNILLTATGTPKVADFGVARLIAGGEAITLSGDVVGTANYMAAEQAVGQSNLGPGVDVWALGVILYELLTGRPPFHGTTYLDTLTHVVQNEPEPPSRLHPEVSRDLEAICLRCLRKEPGRRYHRARDLADDLQRFRSGEPTHARPASPGNRLWKWAGRQPVAASLLAVESLLLALALGALSAAHVAAVRDRSGTLTALDDAEAALYASRVALARAEIEAGHFAAAEAVLGACLPLAEKVDRRDTVWHDLWQRCRGSRH